MKIAILILLVTACSRADADRKVSAGEGVLAKYCVKCHGPVRAESDFGFAHDMDRLVAAGFVVPGDPDASPIVRRIEAGEMPPAGKRPNKAEIAALRATIAELQRSEFREDAELERILAADLARLDRDARVHARWFSLAHLANAGVPEPQLASYRSRRQRWIAASRMNTET